MSLAKRKKKVAVISGIALAAAISVSTAATTSRPLGRAASVTDFMTLPDHNYGISAPERPVSVTALLAPGPRQMPLPAAVAPAGAPSAASASPAPPAYYRVRPGDTLSRIARRLGGSASLWPLLWGDNRGRLPDPNAISAGERLRLPVWARAVPRRLLRAATRAAAPPAQASSSSSSSSSSSAPPPPPPPSGSYSCSALESLWVSAGGPASEEVNAASVAMAESGGNPGAYNPSGASGLWQILGQVVGGDIFNPMVNAENAVAKYDASGWAPWVTWPSAAGIC